MSDFSEKTDKFPGRNRRGENYDVPPVYLIGLMDTEIRQPELLRREIYTKIFEACEIARFNEDKLIQFNKDMYDERRRNGELAAAIEEEIGEIV